MLLITEDANTYRCRKPAVPKITGDTDKNLHWGAHDIENY